MLRTIYFPNNFSGPSNQRMLTLKRIDFYAQVILMTSLLLLVFILPKDSLFAGHIAVGAWLLTSAAIHFFHRDGLLRNNGRHACEVAIIILLSAGIIQIALPVITNYYMQLLLWGGPALAVWYGYITFSELRKWEARALIHLK